MIRQVSPTAPDVVALIEKLNQYQADEFMIGFYINEKLAGIGAIDFCNGYAEIKRMYVVEQYRGRSIASIILSTLETIAFEKGYSEFCLQTGNKHYEAIRFYQRSGYTQIESFGNYEPNDVSIYFRKKIDIS